jgi:hypothetical protein
MRRALLILAAISGLQLGGFATPMAVRASSCDGAKTFVVAGDQSAEIFGKLDDSQVIGYLAGFGSGILMSSLLGSPTDCYKQAAPCVVGRKMDDLVATLRRYLAENPDRSKLPASVVAYNAIVGPCFGLSTK